MTDSTIAGALFDVDGVLIDSEPLYTNFWATVGQKYPTGIPNFSAIIKGTTLTDILNTYFPDPKLQVEITEQVHKFESELYYPIFPGVMDFLEDLRKHGIPTAMVTSSDSVKMNYLFNQHPHFRSYFDAVITGSMVTKSKPDPEGYLIGAQAISRLPGNCFVFEDSIQGLQAGMSSGATVIGLVTTNPLEKLQGKAHKLITGFTGFNVDDMLSISRL